MRTDDGGGLSRREFLGTMALGAGALSAGLGLGWPLGGRDRSPLPIAVPPAPEPLSGPSPNPQRVLVIGAGLAGLAAAWELDAAGHDVTVLEARSRPGGRVHTLREPFAQDLYAEAGAVAFSEAYTEANRYIDALGLERAAWAQPDLRALYHLRGRRLAVGPGETPDWPYELMPEEARLGPMGILQRYVLSTLPEAISHPSAWNEPPLAGLDEQSLAGYMRSQGASEGAIELTRDTQFFMVGRHPGSALSSALSDFGLFFGGAPFLLADGNDRLPQGMARQLRRRIRYGVEVTEIRDTEDGVEVRARRGDRPETYRADRAICAVPLGVLRALDVTPAMSSAKQAAVDGIPYMTATRTYFQLDRAFWYDEGVAGMASTDLPVGAVYRHPLADAAGPEERTVLESYAVGPEAEKQASLTDDELLEYTLASMEKVHPGISDHVEGTAVKAWSRDPHALGHVSWPAPGDVTAHLADLQRPHGRIHFAGEHTTVLRGTMEGALRSGIRAAREVDEGGSR